MFSKISLLLLFIVNCQIFEIQAQVCVPDPIENIELSDDNILQWSASENCPETQYDVHIYSAGDLQYEYTVDELNLNVSFLTYCRSYNFSVIPSSNHVTGVEWFLMATINHPKDMQIGIMNFTATEIDNDLLLQWRVDEKYVFCVDYYYFVRQQENSRPFAIYVDQPGYVMALVTHCMKYKFQVTPYYLAIQGITTDLDYMIPEATNTPSLVEVRQDSSTVNTTWSLEKYYANMCTVSALHVNGTHFSASYAIADAVQRPDVQISISGLLPNSMYYFDVSVENTAGISKPVRIAVQTLPLDPSI